MKIKRKLAGLLAVVMLIGMCSVLVYALEATPTDSVIIINGNSVQFDAYLIDDNNYFKLRDLAYALNGTGAQFEVGWNEYTNAISLTSGCAYTPVGGEMSSGIQGEQIPVISNAHVVLDSVEKDFVAYTINDNNYFKLRDIGEALNFSIDWDESSNSVVIDTSKEYMADTSIEITETVQFYDIPGYTIPDFGKTYHIDEIEGIVDAEGGGFRYPLYTANPKIMDYVLLLMDYGFNLITFDDYAIISLEKDDCYIDIGFFMELGEIAIVITLPTGDDGSAISMNEYTVPSNFLSGYQPADFNAMNSFGTVNGLTGTKIYLEGYIEDVVTLSTEYGDVYYGYFVDSDNHKWLVILQTEYGATLSEMKALINKDSVLCAEYSGYSSVEQLPAMDMEKMYIKENGTIVYGIE